MSRTVPSARQQSQVPAPQQAKVSCITSVKRSTAAYLWPSMLTMHRQALSTCWWLQCYNARCMSSQQCSGGSYTSSCCMFCCRPGCNWLERVSSPPSRAGSVALQQPWLTHSCCCCTADSPPDAGQGDCWGTPVRWSLRRCRAAVAEHSRPSHLTYL